MMGKEHIIMVGDLAIGYYLSVVPHQELISDPLCHLLVLFVTLPWTAGGQA